MSHHTICTSAEATAAGCELPLLLLKLLYQLWHRLEEIRDESNVCDLEDRGLAEME